MTRVRSRRVEHAGVESFGVELCVVLNLLIPLSETKDCKRVYDFASIIFID